VTEGAVGVDEKKLKTVATLGYALQAAGFLVGVTWIAAVVLAYVQRDDAAGTWLESHYRWQIRTFWWSLVWGAIGFVLFVVVIGVFVLIADGVWMIYRIVKGWLRLSENRPVA
jgi:uncharacterized membrane protein